MNFIFRTLSSVVLVSVFFLSVLWGSPWASTWFTVFTAFLTFIGVLEFLRMLAGIGRKSYPLFTAVAGALMVIVSISTGIAALPVLVLFTVIGWILILCAGQDREVLDRVLNSIAGLTIILMPLSCLIGLYLADGNGHEAGRKFLLYLVIVTKAGDIGAYLTGTLTNRLLSGGNHKVIPSISPKKSWEGLGGGLFLSVLSSILTWKYLALASILPYPFILMLGVILFLGGFAGDLAESSLKRMANSKDSGCLVPGIGGVLDLLDSFLINAPLFYYLLKYQGLA